MKKIKERKKRIRGSMTLEAAMVLPLYIFFFLTLLSAFYMLEFGQSVDNTLARSAEEISVFATAENLLRSSDEITLKEAEGKSGNIDTRTAQTVLSDAYIFSELNSKIPADYRKRSGLKGGINILSSSVDSESGIVDIKASYGMEPVFNFFFLKPVSFNARAYTKMWKGYAGSVSFNEADESERTVFVTENASVYHLSRSCTHLDLTVRQVDPSSLDSQRNVYGNKYKKCEKCGNIPMSRIVYLTDEGDRYHNDFSCPGLTRYIREIPISMVGDLRLCSRCAKKGGN